VNRRLRTWFAGLGLAAAVCGLLGSAWAAGARDLPERVYDATLVLRSTEGGGGRRLSELGNGVCLLLPVYTRCRSTCELMATRLMAAWGDSGPADAPARVLLVSFDAQDTPEDLRHFSEIFRLPATWTLAVPAPNEGARLFASLGFQWLTLGGRQFDHAGKLFVLTPNWRVAAVLGPDQLSRDRLKAEVEAALHGPTLLRKIGSHWIGFFGVGLVLLLLVSALALDRLRSRPGASTT
jgi:cytochrome oxidase Cu insertion factor (SCO1/SenC/PrrC family)